MADRGNTWDVTSTAADKAEAGDLHGAKQGVRERVAGQRENLSGESSGVGSSEGGREASGVAENSGGEIQGVGGGVDLPRGINTPGVEEVPWGDKTSGVTSYGYKV